MIQTVRLVAGLLTSLITLKTLIIKMKVFTVFGSVIDDGMVIADEIASFLIHPFWWRIRP